MYLIGISCCLYSDTDADEICIDSGGIVYFAHVGEYFNTYTGYGGLVRFYERIFRRGALIFGMVYNFCLL